jgi:hypothetical protein
MKTRMFLLLTACAALVRADVTDDLLDQLKSEVKAEVKAAREKNDDGGQQRAYQMQEILLRLQRTATQVDNGEYSLAQTVESIGALSTSERVEKICKALARELHNAQEKSDKTLVEEVEKTLGGALRATLDGKTARDLDPPLVATGKIIHESEMRSTRNAKLQALQNQGQQLYEFIRQWQDYLAGVEAGNTDAARAKLGSLISSSRDFSGFMPRSELLAKLNELQKQAGLVKDGKAASPETIEQQAREIVIKTKTLDEIPRAIAEIEALVATNRNTGFASNTPLATLRTFNRNYEELKKGLAANISLSALTSGSSFEGNEALTSLRNQLILFALPRVLALPAGESAKPDENIATFLQRVLDSAKEKQNWTLAGRIVDVAQTLSLNVVASSSDRTALQSFLAGSNQERARQFALAVSSYQAALRTGSQIVAAELIGDHLEAIRKDHPQEFEQGVLLMLNPPAQADSRNPGRPPGFPTNWPFSPGSSPSRPPGSEAPPVLTVPATPAKSDAAGESAKGSPSPEAPKAK